jgi:hypothetical protein
MILFVAPLSTMQLCNINSVSPKIYKKEGFFLSFLKKEKTLLLILMIVASTLVSSLSPFFNTLSKFSFCWGIFTSSAKWKGNLQFFQVINNIIRDHIERTLLFHHFSENSRGGIFSSTLVMRVDNHIPGSHG